jgi:NAD dependent epimerase/dehydratase family enzyme
MFVFAIENDLDGSYNALAGNESNKELMKTIALVLNKPFWFPNVPAFMLRWMFGEMSLILLKGVRASNTKIVQKGFVFQFPNLKDALTNLLKK